jgi:hypothetical protein
LASLFKRCKETWRGLLKFTPILAIENPKKTLDFSTFNVQFRFLAIYIYIAIKEKKAAQQV